MTPWRQIAEYIGDIMMPELLAESGLDADMAVDLGELYCYALARAEDETPDNVIPLKR